MSDSRGPRTATAADNLQVSQGRMRRVCLSQKAQFVDPVVLGRNNGVVKMLGMVSEEG